MTAGLVLAPATQRRFWEKVRERPADGCWEWLGARSPKGYGQFSIGAGEVWLAHRVSYTLHVGPIGDGMTVDHLCHNKWCVNPLHLDQVTRGENAARAWRDGLVGGNHGGAINRAKTHCKRGHEYAGDNLYTDPRGDRYCRACKREADRRRNAAKKDAAA